MVVAFSYDYGVGAFGSVRWDQLMAAMLHHKAAAEARFQWTHFTPCSHVLVRMSVWSTSAVQAASTTHCIASVFVCVLQEGFRSAVWLLTSLCYVARRWCPRLTRRAPAQPRISLLQPGISAPPRATAARL